MPNAEIMPNECVLGTCGLWPGAVLSYGGWYWGWVIPPALIALSRKGPQAQSLSQVSGVWRVAARPIARRTCRRCLCVSLWQLRSSLLRVARATPEPSIC